MKLSALLLLAASTCGCVAQSSPAFPSNQNVGVVDDQALSRAAAAMAASARVKELQGMMERINQVSCPLVLTSAWLTPRLQLLRSDNTSGGDGLDLEFRNASGKEIHSIELSATILVKKSIYDLGYLPPVHLYLTAYGIRTIDSAFAQLRHLSLPTEMHPSLVESVRLEQVTFADGSVWTSTKDSYCEFSPERTLPVAR